MLSGLLMVCVHCCGWIFIGIDCVSIILIENRTSAAIVELTCYFEFEIEVAVGFYLEDGSKQFTRTITIWGDMGNCMITSLPDNVTCHCVTKRQVKCALFNLKDEQQAWKCAIPNNGVGLFTNIVYIPDPNVTNKTDKQENSLPISPLVLSHLDTNKDDQVNFFKTAYKAQMFRKHLAKIIEQCRISFPKDRITAGSLYERILYQRPTHSQTTKGKFNANFDALYDEPEYEDVRDRCSMHQATLTEVVLIYAVYDQEIYPQFPQPPLPPTELPPPALLTIELPQPLLPQPALPTIDFLQPLLPQPAFLPIHDAVLPQPAVPILHEHES